MSTEFSKRRNIIITVYNLLNANTNANENFDINRGCLVYMFSLRFSGSKFLINLRRQFRVHKIFRNQGFAEFTAFSFGV